MKNHLQNATILLVSLAAVMLLAGSAQAATDSLDDSIPSLAGTTADGNLQVTADQQLVIDGELRLFFDYFVSARGEVEDSLLLDRVEREASRRVPAAAAAEATSLFARYLRYFDVAQERLATSQDPAQAFARQRQLHAIRAEILGADTAKALFGHDLRLERAALELQAARLEARTPEQLEAATRAYEKALPASELAARAASRLPLEIAKKVEALRARGASDLEIWTLRADAFGSAAADRLAALDRQRAER